MGTSAVWGPQLYGDLSCMGTSAIWGPQLYGGLSYMRTVHLLVHLASCTPPAPQQSPWGEVAAPPGLQFGELLFTFGGQKSLMAVTFFVY